MHLYDSWEMYQWNQNIYQRLASNLIYINSTAFDRATSIATKFQNMMLSHLYRLHKNGIEMHVQKK